jgi:hypothetical protein
VPEINPIGLLASRLRDAAEPKEAEKPAAALAAVAAAAQEAHHLAADFLNVFKEVEDGAVARLADHLAYRAEGIARLISAGDEALRVSPVGYLAGLLPGRSPEEAAAVAGALARLGQAVADLAGLAGEIRELAASGAIQAPVVAADLADRLRALAWDLGAGWELE